MTTSELNRIARRWARGLGDERPLLVVWNPRMRSLAGTADFSRREVALNERLLRRRPKETLATLAHEVCHLVAGPRAGHGPRWADAMISLGYSPETSHTLDVSELKQRRRRWLWNCLRCRQRIVRTHTGAHLFRCLCGGDLVVASSSGAPVAKRPPRRARLAA